MAAERARHKREKQERCFTDRGKCAGIHTHFMMKGLMHCTTPHLQKMRAQLKLASSLLVLWRHWAVVCCPTSFPAHRLTQRYEGISL